MSTLARQLIAENKITKATRIDPRKLQTDRPAPMLRLYPIGFNLNF